MLGKRLLSGGKNYRKTVCTILNCTVPKRHKQILKGW